MVGRWLMVLGLAAVATPAAAQQAQYEIMFEGRWTSDLERPGSAHFSTLVGAMHNSDVALFAVGEPASTGVERVAETGSTTVMRNEINGLISAGDADQLILGTDSFISPEEIRTLLVDVDSSYPLLSLLTMIAPSPDWIVGVHDLSLVDSEGDWIPQIVLDLNSYDAGTENGSGLSTNNSPTFPRGVITALDTAVPNGALFGAGSIARLTVTLVSPPSCEGDIADLSGFGDPDGTIDFGDFFALSFLAGPCGSGTANEACLGDLADATGFGPTDGVIDFGDFFALSFLAGPCP